MKVALHRAILAAFLLFGPPPAGAEELGLEALVIVDGLYHKKFHDAPYTGPVTGRQSGEMVDGQKTGIWTDRYDDGALLSRGAYEGGLQQGDWVFYWPDGTVMSEGRYRDGVPQGEWVQYHENGEVQARGAMRDNNLTGRWVFYHPDGTLDEARTGHYVAGELVP